MNPMLEEAIATIIAANGGRWGVTAGWLCARISGTTPLGVERGCQQLECAGRIEHVDRYGMPFYRTPEPPATGRGDRT
jgi:hypothetical protein